MRRSSLTPGIRSTAPPGAREAAESAQQAAGEFKVHDVEPGRFLFGSYKNVTVAVWKDSATLSAVERLAKAAAPVRASVGRGSSIHLIADGSGLPTEEARAGFIKLTQKSADLLACLGIVVAGSGFWASALRSAMIGLHISAHRPFEFRLLGSNEEVIQWLPPVHERRTGVVLEPDALRAVLEAATTQAV